MADDVREEGVLLLEAVKECQDSLKDDQRDKKDQRGELDEIGVLEASAHGGIEDADEEDDQNPKQENNRDSNVMILHGAPLGCVNYNPTTETRNRKPLRPNKTSDWELRIDRFRVFYDVNAEEQVVKIKAIG